MYRVVLSEGYFAKELRQLVPGPGLRAKRGIHQDRSDEQGQSQDVPVELYQFRIKTRVFAQLM